jgi:hypothetical protein
MFCTFTDAYDGKGFRSNTAALLPQAQTSRFIVVSLIESENKRSLPEIGLINPGGRIVLGNVRKKYV